MLNDVKKNSNLSKYACVLRAVRAFCVRFSPPKKTYIMASLSLTIIPSRMNSDGTHTIRVVVSHKHKSSYISTNFKVNTLAEWKNGKVVGNYDANIINRKLRNLLNKYEDILETLPTERLSCSQVKSMLTQKKVTTYTIKEFLAQKENEAIQSGRTSVAKQLHYLLINLFDFIPENSPFEYLNPSLITKFEEYLYKKGYNCTSARIYLCILKTQINNAINSGIVKYEIHPFSKFRMPVSNIRDIYLQRDEFQAILHYSSNFKLREFSIDIFLLSFYLGGVNYADLRCIDFTGKSILYERKKTSRKKNGEKRIEITIPPEALAIIQKYTPLGLHRRLAATDPRAITSALRKLGNTLGFPKPLMLYSARKTFVQYGFELDIPLYVMEYAIGHTIKDVSNRPIFSYIMLMQSKADKAIRKIIDYAKGINKKEGD